MVKVGQQNFQLVLIEGEQTVNLEISAIPLVIDLKSVFFNLKSGLNLEHGILVMCLLTFVQYEAVQSY